MITLNEYQVAAISLSVILLLIAALSFGYSFGMRKATAILSVCVKPRRILQKLYPNVQGTLLMTKTPMVLSFEPNGSVEYTRDNRLADLWGGEGNMVRVSDIQKMPERNEYYIKWLRGPYAGQDHVYDIAIQYGLAEDDVSPCSIVLFATYELAVEHEVSILNAMRKTGVLFDV